MLLAGIPAHRLPREALQSGRGADPGSTACTSRADGGSATTSSSQLCWAEHEAVLLAMGAGRGVELPLAGRARACSTPSTTCPLCPSSSAGQASGERVVVIGGGNSAVDASRCALRGGAEKVVIVSLEDREHMPAIPEEIDRSRARGRRDPRGVEDHRPHRGGRASRSREPAVTRDARGCRPSRSGRLRGDPRYAGDCPADLLIVAIGQRLDDSVLGGLGIGLECEDEPRARRRRDAPHLAPTRVRGGGPHHARPHRHRRHRRRTSGRLGHRPGACAGASSPIAGCPPPIPPRSLPRNENKRWRSVQENRRRPARAGSRHAHGLLRRGRRHLRRGERTRGGGPLPVLRHVRKLPLCLDLFGCPAFLLDGDLVEIDPDLCVGCDVCAQFCPNGALAAASARPR